MLRSSNGTAARLLKQAAKSGQSVAEQQACIGLLCTSEHPELQWKFTGYGTSQV